MTQILRKELFVGMLFLNFLCIAVNAQELEFQVTEGTIEWRGYEWNKKDFEGYSMPLWKGESIKVFNAVMFFSFGNGRSYNFYCQSCDLSYDQILAKIPAKSNVKQYYSSTWDKITKTAFDKALPTNFGMGHRGLDNDIEIETSIPDNSTVLSDSCIIAFRVHDEIDIYSNYILSPGGKNIKIGNTKEFILKDLEIGEYTWFYDVETMLSAVDTVVKFVIPDKNFWEMMIEDIESK